MILPEGDHWVQATAMDELLDSDAVALMDEGEADAPGYPTFWHERAKADQRAAAARHSRAKPSTCDEVYWLYATRRKGRYPKPTDRSGKWLVFAPPGEIDAIWARVRVATTAGKLGGSAKVSTRRAFTGKDHVICVYTYDWQDYDDCWRVREELRRLGVTKPIPWKSDEDTLAGRYASNGCKGLAKHYA